MKVKLPRLTVASIVLASFYYGCAGVESRPVIPLPTVPLGQAHINKKNVEVEVGNCTATFVEERDGKLKKGSLNIIVGSCIVDESNEV